MDNKRSPLKDKPLRQPGQSIQEQIDKIFEDKVIPYILFPAFMFIFAVIEWVRFIYPSKPQPIIATIIVLISIAYCAPKIIRVRREIVNLRLGSDGEKIVAQTLDDLRQDGCVILHDIIGDEFNVDHIVVSTKGIFVIETKTYSKPDKNSKVHFDGESKLEIDGIGDKSSVIDQVMANSKWIQEILKKSTGRIFNTRPVVLFPGWWTDSDSHKKVWVLEPKGLVKFIKNEKDNLPPEDVALVVDRLSIHVRSQ